MLVAAKAGTRFQGAATLLHPCKGITNSNITYWNCEVELPNGRFRARAFINDQYRGPEELTHEQTVHINGKWIQWQNSPTLIIGTVAPIDISQVKSTIDYLRGLYLVLEQVPLQNLIISIVRDSSIWPLWQLLPASSHHHHGYQGGLLQHSVEAAWIVMGQTQLPMPQRQIAAVAALLHDIGKIRCYKPDGTLTEMGRKVHHEALTVEVLAPHLAELDCEDAATGVELRRLLHLNVRHQRHDKLDEMVVRKADHLSTLRSLQ